MKKQLFLILALCATTLAWGTTVTKTATQLKDAYGWNNGVYYPSFDLDAVISVNANDGSDNGKFYENADRWRLFTNTDFRPFVISAKEGYVITSVTFTFSGNAGGMLFDATKTNQLTSGTAFVCTTSSVTFYSGYTGTGKESSIRTDITKFSVTYEKGIVEDFKNPDGTDWNFATDATSVEGKYFLWTMARARHNGTAMDALKSKIAGVAFNGTPASGNAQFSTTVEGGVKFVSFNWNQCDANENKTETIKLTVGDKSKEDSFSAVGGSEARPADRTLSFAPEVKTNVAFKIERTEGNRVTFGPITIVPYLFYTTKTASIPLSQDGYKNTDLIDNTDGGTISYASSNTNVATVGSDGTITPYMTGTTTITASWDGVSTSYTLTITAPTNATNSWTETFSQIDEHTNWEDSQESNITCQKGDNDVFTWQFRNYRTYTSGDYKVGLRSGWTNSNDYVAQQDVSEGGIKYISMVWVPNSSGTNSKQVKFTMGDMTAGSILRTFEAEANTLSTSAPITTTMRYDIKKNAQIRVQIPNSATKDNEQYNSIKIKSITVTPYLLYTQKKVYKKVGDANFTMPIINNTDGKGSITYTTIDNRVATVGTNGQVTIKGPGWTTITATWTNGSNIVTTKYRLNVYPDDRGYVDRFTNCPDNLTSGTFRSDIQQKNKPTAFTWQNQAVETPKGTIKHDGPALFNDGVKSVNMGGDNANLYSGKFLGGIKYMSIYVRQAVDYASTSGKTLTLRLRTYTNKELDKKELNLTASKVAQTQVPYHVCNADPWENTKVDDVHLFITNAGNVPFYIDSLVVYPYIQYIKDSVIRKKSYPSAAEMKYDVANEDVLINNIESGDGTVTYSIIAPATRKSTISGHIVDFSAVTEDEILTIQADWQPKSKTNHIKTTFQLKVQVLNTYEPSITFMQVDATNTIRKNITDAAFTPEYILRVNGADHTNDIDVTLTSSNPNVISVGENNQLTITGAGTATITATAPENDTYDSRALNASFNVVVTGYEDDTKLIEDYSKVPATTGWVHSETTFTSAAYGTQWKINHFNTNNSGDKIDGQKAVRLSKDNGGSVIKSDGTTEGGIKAVAFDWYINAAGTAEFGVTAGSTSKTAQYSNIIKSQVTHYEQFFGEKSNCSFQFLVKSNTSGSFILGPISITPYIYYTTREVFLDIASTPKESFDSKAVLIDNTGDEGTITFSSANTSVATVDANGVITAVGSGETYVTATWSEGATTRIHVITAEKFDRIWNLILGKPDGSGDDNVIVTFNQEIIRDIDRTNKTITILGLGGETKTAVKIATNPASAVNENWQTIVGSVSNTVIGKWTKNADYNYTFTIENWSALTYLENGEVPPAPDEPLKPTTTTLNNGADITTTLAAAPATLPLSVTYDDVFVTKIPIEDPYCEFTSSDENVATIDENGQVTVVGIGTAELKAHFLETGKYAESESTINITVNVPEGEQSWTETFSQIDEHTTWQKTSSVTNQKGDNDVFTWQFLNYRTYTSGDYKIGLRSGWEKNTKKNDYVAQQTVSEGGIKYISMVWVPNSNDATNPNPVYFTMGDMTSGSILRTYQAPANSLSTSTPITTMMRYDIKKNAQLRVQIKNSEKESPEEYNSMKIKSITVTPYLLYTTKFHKIDVANGELDTWTNEDLINNTEDGTIVYSIENIEGEGVAEIDAASGQVTAKSNGKAKVTATWTPADAKSGEVVTTTYEVEVFMEKFAAELAFNPEEINAYVNETAISTPTLSNPHGLDVKYSSSNENIAIVAGDGSVTLKGVAGDVIISATSDETDTYKEGNDSYTIHVLKLTPEMTFTAPASVALDGAINESDINVVVTAGGQPVENPEITFTSSDENVIKISNDGWKVIGIGTTTITANVAGTATYESVSENVNIEVTNITPAAGTYWIESFSSLGNKDTYQGYTTDIAGDYGVTWIARNFRHKTSDESDKVDGEYGVCLEYAGKDASRDGYIETNSLEGGVKRLQFKWRTPENSANPKFTVEFDSKATVYTVDQEQKAADAGTVYNFGYNANIAKNAKFTIRVTSGTCASIFGPLTVVPYLFYTTKVVEKTFVVDGTNTVDASANLINNLEDGEVTYSLSAGAQATIDGSTITLANATEDVTVTATWGEVSTTFTLKVTKADDPVVGPNFVLENKTAGAYATICLPKQIAKVENATLYSISYGNTQMIEFVEADLENDNAGMPYLVQVAADGNVNFYYGEGEAVKEPVSAKDANGFVGSLQEDPQEIPSDGSAILVSGGQLHIAGEWCYLSKNHAYITTAELPKQAASVGMRRTIRLYNAEIHTPTGWMDVNANANVGKIIRNGQLFIIRESKVYSAQGMLVK